MPRNGITVNRGRGRPPYDQLFIYLWVEAGAKLNGMSINRFCDTRHLELADHPNRPASPYSKLHPSRLMGASLKRRFYASKKAVRASHACPPGVKLKSWPDPLDRLIDEMARNLKKEGFKRTTEHS